MKISVSVTDMLVLIYRYQYWQKYRLGEYIFIGILYRLDPYRSNPIAQDMNTDQRQTLNTYDGAWLGVIRDVSTKG
jgi:hypothetical protein